VDPELTLLARALRDNTEGLSRTWLTAYEASTVRMPRPVDRAALAQLVSPILESMADMLAPMPRAGAVPEQAGLVPGSAEAREVEKAAAFVGASVAAGAASGFDLAALMLTLRRVLGAAAGPAAAGAVEDFVEWLAVLAMDSFATARVAAERERWREQLENGTPVLMVAPEVPAAFLVGQPDARLLEALFSRLLLLAVRVGARTIVIDASGLAEPGHPAVTEAFDRFLAHPKVAGRTSVVVVGLEPEAEERWLAVGQARDVPVTGESHFDRAVSHALATAGYRLIPPG
jgi:hypothetical protein